MALGRFGTLTVKNIAWCYFKHNGKLALGHKEHAIMFYEGFYLIKEMGEIVYVGFNMVECLEVAHEYVCEYHAKKFQPCWAPIHGEQGAEHEAVTQRSPVQEL